MADIVFEMIEGENGVIYEVGQPSPHPLRRNQLTKTDRVTAIESAGGSDKLYFKVKFQGSWTILIRANWAVLTE